MKAQYYRKSKSYRRNTTPRADREKVTAGQYKVGDTLQGKRIVSFGKTWQEGFSSYQYAYFTAPSERVMSFTFSSGQTVYQNARGRCEDAPCCGCCS